MNIPEEAQSAADKAARNNHTPHRRTKMTTTDYRVTVDLLDKEGVVTGTEIATFAAVGRTDAVEAAIEFAIHDTTAADAVVRLVEEVQDK